LPDGDTLFFLSDCLSIHRAIGWNSVPAVCVELRTINRRTSMTERRYFPTAEDVVAMERAARRARAQELRRLAIIAGSRLRALIVRGVAALVGKRRSLSPARHGA
jgi:hypothetical protein